MKPAQNENLKILNSQEYWTLSRFLVAQSTGVGVLDLGFRRHEGASRAGFRCEFRILGWIFDGGLEFLRSFDVVSGELGEWGWALRLRGSIWVRRRVCRKAKKRRKESQTQLRHGRRQEYAEKQSDLARQDHRKKKSFSRQSEGGRFILKVFTVFLRFTAATAASSVRSPNALYPTIAGG
ncbi:hypothetical protein L3X38_007572 [Prunus dulcis]|uniref:Uncharacterized protein n=1 Tax=Prunus dulcis TaxID=3755 RepID=A0AAD5F639_PRUDU|nr:hypothetical protein L3X38_007572 [Prunus dulcis]